MSQFAKATEILREALQGRDVPYGSREKSLRPPPPAPMRTSGDPVRLKEAYRALRRAALAYIENPTQETLGVLKYKQNYCSQIEPSCAPQGSPWIKPPFGKDNTSFAPDREVNSMIFELLALPPSSGRWVFQAERIRKAISEL